MTSVRVRLAGPAVATPALVVDIYADAAVIAAGLTVGTAIRVQVVDGGPVRLSTKATRPTLQAGFNTLSRGDNVFENEMGDSGAWVYSPNIDSEINVAAV